MITDKLLTQGELREKKREALEYLDNYINAQLNSPVARRTRMLAALAAKNPVIKVSWDQPEPEKKEQ